MKMNVSSIVESVMKRFALSAAKSIHDMKEKHKRKK